MLPPDESSTTPRVSVIVTFYNQAHWVKQSLDSVAAQTEPDIQLIITDDGSSDGTPDEIAAWRSRRAGWGETALSAENLGLPAALNRTIPLLRGRYVMVLNGDDWLDPERVRHQADALDEAPRSVGIVYSQLRVMTEQGEPTGETFPPEEEPWPEGNVLHRIVAGTFIGMPSVMFRREILDLIGPWDESLAADDFDFLLRAAAAGVEFRHVPHIDTNYRQYGSSLTGAGNTRLVDDRITALLRHRGIDKTTDRLIHRRIQKLAVNLHSAGHPDRRVTAARLRYAACRYPTRQVIRATLECHLHLPPRSLSPRAFVRRLKSLTPQGRNDRTS